MTNHDISPLTVADYSNNFIIETVRHFTGWNERGEVSEKAQLKYLFGYLSSNHVLAKTVLVENEYIDRNFLEDYSRYYARCFDTYSKTCARIHFFKNPFTEHEFINAITSDLPPTTLPVFIEKSPFKNHVKLPKSLRIDSRWDTSTTAVWPYLIIVFTPFVDGYSCLA